MASDIVFWIVCGCLIFSLCESLWRYLHAMRNSETKQEVNDRWCGFIDDVLVYATFIVLYATESFSFIYYWVCEYFNYCEFGWSYFLWCEGAFVLAVVLIWIAASLPASILRVITSSDNTKEIIKTECFELFRLALVPLAIGYMMLIEAGPIWALIPFFWGLLCLVVLIVDATNNFSYLITWRMMLWVSIQAVAVLCMGIVARELMSCWQFSEAMGLRDFSYAANIISIVIIGGVVVKFLFAADEHLKPKMYLPMAPSNIKEWKEKHQTELTETTESENTENKCERDVKDE